MSRAAAYVLPGALRPGPGESLPGLVMRNAERLRFPNPMRVLSRVARPPVALSTFLRAEPEPTTASALAALLGLSEAEMRRMATWHPEQGVSSVWGARIEAALVGTHDRRVCPGCIAEDGHDRAWWYVQPLAVCHVHRRAVLRSCPACGGRLAWRGVGLHRCGNRGCRHDLRAEATAAEGPEPPSAHVRGLLALLDGGSDATTGYPFGFGRAVGFAFRVGSLVRGDDRPGRVSSFARRRRAELPRLMEDGWAALQDWPRGFHAALDEVRKRAGGRGGLYGLRRELGHLPDWIATVGGEDWAAPLKEAFASYLEARPDFRATAAGLRRLGTPDALRSRRPTLGEAADRLGVCPARMAELADREGMLATPRAGAGVPALVEVAPMERLLEAKRGSLRCLEAKALLGVGQRALEGLLEGGLLSLIPPAERLTRQRCIRREDVERLVRDMVARVDGAEHGHRSGRRYARFSGASGGHGSTGDVCRAVLEGRLVPRGRDLAITGVGGLLFDYDEASAALRPPLGTLSIKEAAARLG